MTNLKGNLTSPPYLHFHDFIAKRNEKKMQGRRPGKYRIDTLGRKSKGSRTSRTKGENVYVCV